MPTYLRFQFPAIERLNKSGECGKHSNNKKKKSETI